MLKIHVAERLAIAAGLVPPDRPARRMMPLGIMIVVLAAIVVLMGLYFGVRELAQPAGVGDRAGPRARLQRMAPAAGPDRLMSIEDMRRIAGQE